MSEALLGLNVSRPVLNINQAICDKLWEKAQSRGIKRGHMVRLLCEESRLALLKPREIRKAQKIANVDVTPEETHKLMIYLEQVLPDSVDEHLFIPTFPVHEMAPGRKTTSWLFSIAAGNATVLSERMAAIKAITDFYGLDPNPDDAKSEWHDSEYSGGLEVVSTNRQPRRLKVIRSLLDISSPVLPVEIVYSPVDIDKCVDK